MTLKILSLKGVAEAEAYPPRIGIPSDGAMCAIRFGMLGALVALEQTTNDSWKPYYFQRSRRSKAPLAETMLELLPHP